MAREYKDSGIEWIGQIPKEWEVCPHKHIMFKKKEIQEHYAGQDIISLTMNGVVVRDLDAGGKMPLSFDGYQIIYPNNLLLCLFDIDVTPRCVGLINNYGVTSPAYSQFVVKEKGYPPYYDYLLRYMDDHKCLLHLSKNLRSSLTETDFGQIKTCIPPYTEQQKIADYLDKVCGEADEMLALQEKMIEELKAYKQSIITEAVTKGLNPNVPMKNSGIDWIGEIPEHWKVIRIKYLLKERKERSVNGVEEPLSMSQKYGLIPTKDMEMIPNMASSFVGAKLVYKNDLVFNKLKAHLGVFAVSDYEGLVSPDYAVYSSTSIVNEKYLEYLFKTPQYIGEFIKLSSGVGAGLTRLYTSDLYSINGIVPPIEEQNAIVSFINTKCSEIDSLIAIKQQKITELKEYKKSIIYEYVTGKKEVV